MLSRKYEATLLVDFTNFLTHFLGKQLNVNHDIIV